MEPQLRFPEFFDSWNKSKLKSIAKFYSGGTPKSSNKDYYENGTIPFIKSGEINSSKTDQYITVNGFKSSSAKMVSKGDILYALYGATSGEVAISKIEGAINQAVLCIKSEIDHDFLVNLLSRNKSHIIRTFLQGGQGNLSAEIVKSLDILFPSAKEQQKIASFLTIVDQKITKLKEKKELLEQYKKGVMQQIFSQKLRFKDEFGNDFPEWEEKTLGEVSERIRTKNKENNLNVLTISAQQGLINQEEYFNRSVAAKDVTGYYLLQKGDFAYNKSYSNGYPLGAIKLLKNYDKGVVSTLYICFKFNSLVLNEFAEQYFESGSHNREIELIAQEGARNHGLLNVGVKDFFETRMQVPSINEQKKISTFLSTIDKKISSVKTQIDLMETWKKGLLQQMFV